MELRPGQVSVPTCPPAARLSTISPLHRSTSSCLLQLLLRLYGPAVAHSRMPLFHSLLEESYIMKDPFSSDKGRFLVLGAWCSVCGRLVCVGPVGTPGDFLFVPGWGGGRADLGTS